MTIPRLRSSFLILLFLVSAFSCQDKTNEPGPDNTEQPFFVKAVFNYGNNTFDETRIFNVSYKKDESARTSANIQIRSQVTLTEGEYGVAEFFDDAVLIIDASEVVFGNLNPNNTKVVKVIIKKGATLRINSSLNQNGKFLFYNYGTLYTGNHELQNGTNEFNNYGIHVITGDLQISSGNSVYNNCGTVTVSNYTNFHSGKYNACDCGQLITSNLNVNGSYKVSGKGYIKVTGNLNLNGHLTDSPDIQFCYTGHINQVDKLGSAKRTCEPSCIPTSLPLKYTNIKARSFKAEREVLGEISFDVTENTDLLSMDVLVSTDGRNWKVAYKEEDASVFVQGKRYISLPFGLD